MRDGRGVAYVICNMVRDTQEPLSVCVCVVLWQNFCHQAESHQGVLPVTSGCSLSSWYWNLWTEIMFLIRNSGSKVLGRYVLVSTSGIMAEKTIHDQKSCCSSCDRLLNLIGWLYAQCAYDQPIHMDWTSLSTLVEPAWLGESLFLRWEIEKGLRAV